MILDKVMVGNAASQTEILRLVRSLLPVAVPGGLVRVGPPGDGGYLMPDDFEGIAACLSPGISNECGFDLAVADRGIPVIMADASRRRNHFSDRYAAHPRRKMHADHGDQTVVQPSRAEGVQLLLAGRYPAKAATAN